MVWCTELVRYCLELCNGMDYTGIIKHGRSGRQAYNVMHYLFHSPPTTRETDERWTSSKGESE